MASSSSEPPPPPVPAPDHIPKFRSTVWVAEMRYTSPSTFSQKKAAEQDVARLALEGILHRTRDEGLFLVDQV
ncbi:hypothetical protein JHK85_010447 [Glycine max]|nr:hypothetical protein JHK85_010447 [Glycine max]KAG5066447.1 hypothetical protein JHK86_010178 [Glycine max]